MPNAFKSSPRPMPDSISSLGEPMAPALTITSRAARMRSGRPRRPHATPTARPLSTTTRVANARVLTVRFGRAIAGRRYASTALQRRALRLVTW